MPCGAGGSAMVGDFLKPIDRFDEFDIQVIRVELGELCAALGCDVADMKTMVRVSAAGPWEEMLVKFPDKKWFSIDKKTITFHSREPGKLAPKIRNYVIRLAVVWVCFNYKRNTLPAVVFLETK